MTNYFTLFEHRSAPQYKPLSPSNLAWWHVLAGSTIGLGVWYLTWRWAYSLNPDALLFSALVAIAETAAFLGTLIFFFDIWDEVDTPKPPSKISRRGLGLVGPGPVRVDVFITTYDEAPEVVLPSILAAKQLISPENTTFSVWVLDDGNRPEMAEIALRAGVQYLSRSNNMGYKAGNLRNALNFSNGDFILICDADTRVFPTFLLNTIGYFSTNNVAWVQTPHWFYDIPSKDTPGVERQPFSIRKLFFRKGGIEISDPFLAKQDVFFDVIQRRRNRHGASFCCGAGSIHRRSAIFENALEQIVQPNNGLSGDETVRRSPLKTNVLQPFRFHVSEDILTSTQLHLGGWKSVYHPRVEARMLSPWSVDAWASQKLKYSGGSFDIFLNKFDFISRKMPWTIRLHYLATFFSYCNIFWIPILIFAPCFSLLTGIAPIRSYSVEFFIHLIPMLIINELAMVVGCKGYDTFPGRISILGSAHIQMRAFLQVLRNIQPKFPTTPKAPGVMKLWKYTEVHVPILFLFLFCIFFGLLGWFRNWEGYSANMVVVNTFWLGWVTFAILRTNLIHFWSPELTLSQESNRTHCERGVV